MPTNGVSTKPLKVKLLAGEQKATKFRDPSLQNNGQNPWRSATRSAGLFEDTAVCRLPGASQLRRWPQLGSSPLLAVPERAGLQLPSEMNMPYFPLLGVKKL